MKAGIHGLISEGDLGPSLHEPSKKRNVCRIRRTASISDRVWNIELIKYFQFQFQLENEAQNEKLK